MALTTKLTQTPITLSLIAFYGAVGIIFLALLFLTNFPPHIALIGIVNVITAYGLLKKRFWAPWLAIALFFIATTFSTVTLYYTITTDALASIAMIAYLALTWVFTAYVISKRDTLKPEAET